MRITILQVPYIFLALLPLVIAYNGHGFFGTLFWMILWLAVRQAIVIFKIKSKQQQEDTRIILNSLPISHYVEKVRWCLDKTGLNYEEEKDVGIFWVMTTGRTVPSLNIPGKNICISNSSDILKYLFGHLKGIDEEKAEFLNHSPAATALEAKIDLMGRNIRTYIYYHILVANKNADEIALKTWGIHETEIPPWQKSLLKVFFPIIKKFLITVLDITKEHAEKNLKRSEEFFEEMDKILNKNKFILGTENPTYIDYAFASIAAIYALPDQYGGHRLTPESRLKLTDFSLEFQKSVKKFRNTPSGKFVLNMYAEHR